MREIKFRAWDADNKKMISVFEPEEQGKREYYPFVIPIGFSHYDKSKITLLQFTGLKDKNNKEIYEGDVVTRTRFLSGGDTGRYEVYFEDGCFLLKPELTIIHDYLHNANNVEVIGNIYENPELITQK